MMGDNLELDMHICSPEDRDRGAVTGAKLYILINVICIVVFFLSQVSVFSVIVL